MRVKNKFDQVIVDKDGVPYTSDVINVSLRDNKLFGTCELTGAKVSGELYKGVFYYE